MQLKPRTKKNQHGFTIVELMVALVVSLLAATGIYTIFSQSSAQQARTGETQDMWQQARIAMAMIERDVRMVGYGMDTAGCSRTLTYDSRLDSSFQYFESYPIESETQLAPTYSYDPTASAGIGTQVVTVRYASDTSNGVPVTKITEVPANTAADLKVSTSAGMAVKDRLLLKLTSGVCAIVQITNINGSGSNINVVHNSGASGPYNPPRAVEALGSNATPAVTITAADMLDATIYNLGQGDNTHIYSISNDTDIGPLSNDATPTLMLTSYNATVAPTTQPIARGIVALQVRYGYDTNNDGNVDAYDVWDTARIDAARTVRIAMLARSALPDRSYRGPASYNLLGASYVVPSSNGDGCANGDCRPYRHQLFQTEIPLRNMIIGQMNQ